jgi:predicted transposase/invertase (TIGR01784 family)
MGEINNPHDAFFKYAFGDKEITKDFIKYYLPKQVTKELDLETLKEEKGSYIDEQLKGLYSDLLFKIKDKDKKDNYIYILFEHKSYNSEKISYQLLKYMMKIWDKKQKSKKLPMIIPVVIYNGKTKWNTEKEFKKIIENPKKQTEKYIPNYQYEIYDLSPNGTKEIVGTAILKMILEMMRAIQIKNQKKFIDEIINITLLSKQIKNQQKATKIYESCVRYIFNIRDDIEVEEIEEKVKEVSKERSDYFMTIADKLIEKGIEKGKLEGIQQGKLEGMKLGEYLKAKDTVKKLLSKKLDKKTISEVTELSIEQIKKIEEEMNENKN